MDKKIVDKIINNDTRKGIPQYKKIWYSISKFERYPEMAAEGVGKAFLYLICLMAIFAIVFTIAIVIRVKGFVDSTIKFLNDEITYVSYEDGNMSINLKDEKDRIITDDLTIVVNTDKTENEEKMVSNENKVIFLQDKIIIGIINNTENYSYSDLFDELGIKNFEKDDILELMNSKTFIFKIYASLAILAYISILMVYIVITLLNVLILSGLGMITGIFAGIKMRYRAVFNMSIYSITISVILQLIYITINVFKEYEIKYFDLMYTAIAYIALTAAIFMIKSDVVKQQIEMIKFANERKNNFEKEMDKKKEDIKDRDERKENEVDEEKNEQDKKANKENKDDKIDSDTEGEGSNA